ncbi:hypothetical protein BWQ96_09254 [Gracilariopsis chorda]|uniref:Uncharacterized protein n=1 Tax=Gracilariopsis chorda TaxID=448386 RepID=A0A2V3IG25_9FLOR|nr:hypothetical protein BWQ96_09254 [Gracilariopsis chorda]|eukprot:PXF41039.1 hypothetical protein BWQ96_09254 [Gracilariopsis chorda]
MPRREGQMLREIRRNSVRQLLRRSKALRLTGISTEAFLSFKQKREIYERRVTEKSSEHGTTIPATSYRNSIQNPVLEMFVSAQWVYVSSVDDITEDHLKASIEERAKVNPEDYDLAQIEKGICKICMDRSVKTLEMQVWQLGLQYATKLEEIGYSKVIQMQPKLAIGRILRRISHLQLRKRMKLTLKHRKE